MPMTPINAPAPLLIGTQDALDPRTVVDNLTALTSNATWGLGGSVYEGLVVYVKSNDSLYVLLNPANYNVPISEPTTGWKKLSTLSTINGEDVGDNIVISLVGTYAGLSSSIEPYNQANLGVNHNIFPALSSSFPYYKNADGTTPAAAPKTGSLWVITGETITARTASNGKMFLYASSSTLSGRWLPISPLPATIVTSYLDNYFNDNIVPQSDSASAILSNNVTTAETGLFPLMFFPSTNAIGNFSTPVGITPLVYNADTEILETTSEATTNIQTSDGTQIPVDLVPTIDPNTGELTISQEGLDILNENNVPNPLDNLVFVDPVTGELSSGTGENATPISAGIKYFTGSASTTQDYSASLKSLQIINYFDQLTIDFDIATGKLTLFFGTPNLPQISSLTDSNTWNTSRFNTTPDDFTITGNWTNGSYNFVSASLQRWEYNPTPKWATLTTKTVGVNGPNTTTISVTPAPSTNTPYLLTGSSYAGTEIASLFNNNLPVASSRWRLVYTGSNPQSGQLFYMSQILKRELNVPLPGTPALTFTYQSNLIPSWNIPNPAGTTSPTIEYGDEGELVAVPAEGSVGLWSRKSVTNGQGQYEHYLYTPNNTLTHLITDNQNSTKFSVTASYYTATANNPDPTIARRSPTYTLSRKRSVRFGRIEVGSLGASAPVLTATDLLDVSNWADDLYNGQDGGGPFIMDQGRIYWNKPDTPSSFGPSNVLSLNVPNSLNYFYIVISSLQNISTIASPTFPATNLLGTTWTLVDTVGLWKVYRTVDTYQVSQGGVNYQIIIS